MTIAVDATLPRRKRRTSPPPPVRNGAITALLVLAVFYTLYITRELSLPIVLALLLALLLSPLVRGLIRLHVPRPLAAGVVVLSLLATTAYGLYALSEPASLWLQKAPQMLGDLERKLRPIKEKVQEVDKAAEQVEKIARPDTKPGKAVEVQPRGVRQLLLVGTQSIVTGLLIMFFLLYFLLATGDRLFQRLLDLMPSATDRKTLVDIAQRIGRHVSTYLGTMALINVVFGGVIALAMYWLGMPNPVLWGVLAAALNFVPYLGPLIMVSILSVVSLLTFEAMSDAVLVPLTFVVLNEIEGDLLTPWLLGQRLSLNPLAIFLGLVFWAWLWGAVGAFLAVPILVTLKVICDNVERLAPAAAILGR